MHRLRGILDANCLKHVYIAIVQSILDYCVTVWGNYSKHNVELIQRLQSRAVRAITGNFDYAYSSNNIIRDLGLMNIDERFIYFLVTLVYKCLHQSAPSCLTECLHYVKDSHDYPTRMSVNDLLALPHPSISYLRTVLHSEDHKCGITCQYLYAVRILFIVLKDCMLKLKPHNSYIIYYIIAIFTL